MDEPLACEREDEQLDLNSGIVSESLIRSDELLELHSIVQD